MKKHIITYLTLSATAGLALMLPLSTFAADNNPNDQKFKKKGGHGEAASGPVQAAAPVVQQQQIVNPAGKHAANPAFAKHAAANQAVVVQSSNPQVIQQGRQRNFRANTSQAVVTAPAGTQYVQQSRGGRAGRSNTTTFQTQVVSSPNGGGQFTRANSYGGRWTAGDNHSDWNRSREHSWNNHEYRWYDGGWLIIDGGFWPVRGGYQSGGSVVANVQGRLADLGYYNGDVDGSAGPMTRHAIANFQNDNNLYPSGRINDPLLRTLGLE